MPVASCRLVWDFIRTKTYRNVTNRILNRVQWAVGALP